MKEKRKKKINFSALVVFGLLFCISIFAIYSGNNYEDKIKTYSGRTIGIASSFENYAKTKDINYYFYINEKRIISKTPGNHITNRYLKKFYIIKYDKTNPENNHILLSNQMHPDSLTLVKAGFKYKKYYEHDIATNTYIERYKWQ